jgi:hypothetical protein
MSFYAFYPPKGSGGGGGGSGVPSVNGITSAVTIDAGTGVSVSTSGSTITITNTGGAGSTTVELFTLTPTDIANGYVTLSSAPTSQMSTILLVTTAPNQFYGSDFIIMSGNHLSWAGLGLDGILASGDTLTVSFF